MSCQEVPRDSTKVRPLSVQKRVLPTAHYVVAMVEVGRFVRYYIHPHSLKSEEVSGQSQRQGPKFDLGNGHTEGFDSEAAQGETEVEDGWTMNVERKIGYGSFEMNIHTLGHHRYAERLSEFRAYCCFRVAVRLLYRAE